MFMRWHELMFMHWPVPASALRPLIPPALQLDTFDGEAWLGVVPFRMTGIRPHWLPPMPGLSAFPELNVRTYVTAGGKPGVWFFSLDATSRVAVRAARNTFHLNYYDADITTETMKDEGGRMKEEPKTVRSCSSFVLPPSSFPRVDYRSTRVHRGAPPAEFAARYGPVGDVFHAKPGTLEYFLTERYCLYAADPAGRCYRGDIAHAPWPLQRAESQTRTLAMTGQLGLPLPDVPPLLHYAERLDVVAWWRRRLT
jgi:uncharacterized protein YqjF (DUF2071 family)